MATSPGKMELNPHRVEYASARGQRMIPVENLREAVAMTARQGEELRPRPGCKPHSAIHIDNSAKARWKKRLPIPRRRAATGNVRRPAGADRLPRRRTALAVGLYGAPEALSG